MKPAGILRELRYDQGRFPEAALREALQQREALLPVMLDALRCTPRQLQARGESWMLYQYALYLTAAWRTAEAMPLIIDFFAHPGDLPVEATGDFVSEDLPRVLASVAHGRLDPVRRLVEDERVSEWTRSANLNTILIMHLTGQLAEGQAADCFLRLLNGGLKETPGAHWCNLVTLCARFHMREALPAIERAYERGLIDPMYVRLDDLRAELTESGSQKSLAPMPWYESLIDDPVAELSRFVWSTEDKSGHDHRDKVKRNAPCPCGSGKKFKHCCREQQTALAAASTAVVGDGELAILIGDGFALGAEGQEAASCRALTAAWNVLRTRLTPAMTTLRSLDACLPKDECPEDLVFEYLIQLGNAALDDVAFAAIGIEFCEFFLRQFTDEIPLHIENVRGALGQFHFRADDAVRGEEVLRSLIADRPRRAIGYAFLADALGSERYAWNASRPLDPRRALAVLEEAVAAGVEDAKDYDLALRLDDMRREAGKG